MKHLSSEQISSVVAGIPGPETMHLRECTACDLEVERTRNMLTRFRSSVREWSDRLDHSEFPVQQAIGSRAWVSQAPHRAPMAWLLAAATLAAAVAIPVYQDSIEREMNAQAQRAEQLRIEQLQDRQLTEAVNAQLSRTGPLAMDPLLRLMAYPDVGSGTESARPHGIEGIEKETSAGTSR